MYSSIKHEDQSKNSTKTKMVFLDKESIAVIDRLVAAARAKFGESISISSVKMVNFLLQRKCDDLTETDLNEIQARFTSPLKFLKSALARAKRAKREGREYSVDDDIKFLTTLGVSGERRSKRGRKPRSPEAPFPSARREQPSNGADVKALLAHPHERQQLSMSVAEQENLATESVGEND